MEVEESSLSRVTLDTPELAIEEGSLTQIDRQYTCELIASLCQR